METSLYYLKSLQVVVSVADPDPPHAYAELEPTQHLVTPPATSVADLNYQITILHEELERIREDARSRFADASQPSRSTNGSGS